VHGQVATILILSIRKRTKPKNVPPNFSLGPFGKMVHSDQRTDASWSSNASYPYWMESQQKVLPIAIDVVVRGDESEHDYDHSRGNHCKANNHAEMWDCGDKM